MLRTFLFCVCLPSLPVVATAQTFATTRNTVMPTWFMSQGDGTYDLAAGDVDGDGDVDLVVARDHDPNLLLLNDGRGNFLDATAGRLITPTTAQPIGFANATYEIELADLDGDGDLDLLMVNDHDLYNRVYLNDGLGFFTDVTATAVPPATEWSVDQVVADFDGDGDPDWLVVNSGPLRLYRNDGTGTFTDISSTNLVGLTWTFGGKHSSAVDLDGDGDLDVLLPGVPTILRNQGGVLSQWTGVLPGTTSGRAFAVDVDGDGLPDLFVADGRRLLRNNGGMVFVDVTATNLPPAWNGTLYACADTDLDGDLDAIGSGILLRNDGTGAFTVAPGLLPIVSAFTLPYVLPTVADVDGDGDPDLVVAGVSTATSTWINFHTQVTTPVAPTLGLPYTIELHAPVRTPPVVFGPAVANAGTRLPLPPYGTLRIDLTQGTFLWPLVAPTGLSTITWTIPNQPALLGSELHYQSVVFDALRAPFLTNTIRDVIQ